MCKHLVVALAAITLGGLGIGCKSAGTDPAVRADLGAKIASIQTPVQACYQRQLTTNRKLRGMIVVQFAATGDTGQFIDVSLRRDEPSDPVLRYCIVTELQKLKLDKPPGARVEVDSVPIKFEFTP